MSFHDPSFHRSIEDLRSWPAREVRYAVRATTTMSTNGAVAAAVVMNISNGGCRITTEAPLRSGDRLHLVVEPLGMVDAEVRWTNETDAGLKFIARNAFYGDYRLAYLP
jgi:hypothetical protein